MCTLPRDEQYAAMDDMGDIDKVVLPAHELAPHFEPEPLATITWREAAWCLIAPFGVLALALLGAWWQM